MKRAVRDAKQNLALILKVLCASVVLLASPCPAVAQKKPQTPVTPTTLPKPTPTPASEQAIPLPQIATRANELSILLGEMVDRLAPQATLNSIDLTLRSQENPHVPVLCW